MPTISTDTNYTDIAATYVSGETIDINDGAIFTINTQPASGVYFGDININEGKFLIDGTNVVSLQLFFEDYKRMLCYRLGEFKITGKYYELGVSDGTANQTFNLPFASLISHCEVETGVGTGVYEVWGNLLDLDFSEVGGNSMGVMGYACKQTEGSSSLLFGDGINGSIPPNGAKIRIYNLIVASTDPNIPGVQSIQGNESDRYEMEAPGGTFDFFNVYISYTYLDLLFSYALPINDTGIIGEARITGVILPLSFNKVVFAGLGSLVEDIQISTCVLDWVDCVKFGKFELSLQSTSGVITGGRYVVVDRLIQVWDVHYVIRFQFCQNFTVDSSYILGHGFYLGSSSDIYINNIFFSDSVNGVYISESQTRGGSFLYIESSANISVGNLRVLPYSTFGRVSLVQAIRIRGLELKNWGSFSAPLDFLSQPAKFFETPYFQGIWEDISIKEVFCENTFLNLSQFALVVSPVQNFIEIENLRIGYDFELPVFGNNQIIKGGQGKAVFDNGGIPTNFELNGTHFYDIFDSDTTGAIGILFTEKSDAGLSQSAFVAIPANPENPIVFNGAGRVYLRQVGDSITYNRSYFVLGYSGFSGHSISSSGSFTIEYDLDTGNGFSGIWKDISNIINETVSPTEGFKDKIRFTANSSNSNNYLRGFFLNGITTLAQQEAAVYLDVTQATLTITNLIIGSEVRIYDVNNNELTGTESLTNSSFEYIYNWTADFNVDLVVFKTDYIPIRITLTLTEAGLTVPIQQRFDRVYLNP